MGFTFFKKRNYRKNAHSTREKMVGSFSRVCRELSPGTGARVEPNTATRSSLFGGSRNVTIYGGNFKAAGGQGEEEFAPSRADPNLSNIPKIPRHLVRSQHSLGRRQGKWRFSIGELKDEKMGEGKVIIQTFEGRQARKLWQSTIDYARRLLDPNFLNIVGTSSEDDRVPYILFDAAHQNSTCHLIACGLRQGEREITMFGTRIVYGIASGLYTLSQTGPRFSLANFGSENFDLFSDDVGNTVLAFTPHGEQCEQRCKVIDLTIHPPWVEGDAVPFEVKKDGIGVFNSLITKVFNDANHIIYREKLDRNDDDDLQFDSSYLNASTKQQRTDPSAERTSARDAIFGPDQIKDIACRREVSWTSLGLNMPLFNISETYEDVLRSISHLDRVPERSSLDLPRRTGQRKSAAAHTCQGYRREEITFTPDAVRNAILIFKQPSLNEVCQLCGEVISALVTSEDAVVSGGLADRKEFLRSLSSGAPSFNAE
ncbi:hypothetical protein GYMLUDRAFT_596930 [Collybiopsis luxurians FD-317 M1]|uniref:Uncharacterized protein n=1 Tax=Collybiopsis luxurians FD-317 M1 TaxID=944289 RepID=A0A0D0BYH2_9AGAR|nr:hypothetical protein GYMLUDRAFT_596930 [Collybiopsis luxurians FD-317 M1]